MSRAYGPAGTTAVSTVADVLSLATLHFEDDALLALREPSAEVAITGWLDAWCHGWARFDWPGGPVYGWDALVPGERSILRFVPHQRVAVALMTNASTGRAMYRSLLPELLGPWLGIDMPDTRLTNPPDDTRPPLDLSRYAGLYAWPDRRVEVVAQRDRLLVTSEGVTSEAVPLDDRTFVVDPADPDNPTITFGDFDGVGRPKLVYLMLWALPRVTQ